MMSRQSQGSFWRAPWVPTHRPSRLLPPAEIEAWAGRLATELAPRLTGGQLHFLWGTDWEDVPIRNAG